MAELSENWFRLAIDHLHLGILIIDREGRICVFNRALSRITGLKENDVLDRPLLAILDGQKHSRNKLLQTISTGKEFEDLNPKTVLPITGSIACIASTHVIRDKSGVTTGALAVFMPAGRQQELEDAVIKAEKLAILGQMAAGMVHEIRNPLTAISGFLQLLQKYLKGTPKEEYVTLTLNELKHVNSLISDFLKLSKPGFSKRTQCSISKIITDVVMLVESEAFLRKLDINVDIATDIPAIVGDSDQLKQVFLNIFKNAFDALPHGGKISLQTSWDRHQECVQVIIKDTGTGMDEQTIASIFDPFFTTKESGTGLGMFIIKKIIDNHGGRIEVQSEQEKGTTVTVLLPVGE
ncbi:two-component system sensor histidine kinase NtrB [Desulfoscipio gibsoniae]|uniref:histidine kinase n=1 Tax=Desulfoscipio gibsoniae DSM 7213 TaxID=767817 RepID=R4KKV5_9FIRM|nr:ATP-binding protein [Desulfoscipio gibsoniae]AGL00271.1 PAS domain S-box [Desulfoscipio gibsoniae DSM 7213]